MAVMEFPERCQLEKKFSSHLLGILSVIWAGPQWSAILTFNFYQYLTKTSQTADFRISTWLGLQYFLFVFKKGLHLASNFTDAFIHLQFPSVNNCSHYLWHVDIYVLALWVHLDLKH